LSRLRAGNRLPCIALILGMLQTVMLGQHMRLLSLKMLLALRHCLHTRGS
jgi:hypothetical protein